MDYKELLKMVDKFTAQDFQDVKDAIQQVLDKNPKATYTEAKEQIERFKKDE